MEAARTFETLVNFYQNTGATSQKTAISNINTDLGETSREDGT
jgi:hypothetical protein